MVTVSWLWPKNMKNKGYNLAIIGTGFALNAALWIATVSLFPFNNSPAILHYSVLVGADMIGTSHQIYLLPTVGLLILTGNFVVGHLIQRVSWRSAAVVWIASSVTQIILAISFFSLWQLNR